MLRPKSSCSDQPATHASRQGTSSKLQQATHMSLQLEKTDAELVARRIPLYASADILFHRARFDHSGFLRRNYGRQDQGREG